MNINILGFNTKNINILAAKSLEASKGTGRRSGTIDPKLSILVLKLLNFF